jgi:hypothetical protein
MIILEIALGVFLGGILLYWGFLAFVWFYEWFDESGWWKLGLFILVVWIIYRGGFR